MIFKHHDSWRTSVVGLSLCGLFIVSLSGCMMFSPAMATTWIWQHKPILIARSEAGRGWGYLSHPFITPFSYANLLLTYNYAGDWKGDPKHPDVTAVWPAISRSGGESWELGRGMVGKENMAWLWAGSIRQGDRVFLYPFIVKSPWKLKAVWYEDGVQKEIMTNVTLTFDSEIKPVPGSTVVLGYKGALLPNGNLVITAHGKFGKRPKSSVIALQSVDNGASFSYLSTIATANDVTWAGQWPIGFEGPNENSIVSLPNGDLLCVMRVGTKQFTIWQAATEAIRMLQSRSRDGGQTWRHTCLPMEGVSPKLVQMRNGVLVLGFGRPGNSLAFSIDGGRIWAREIAVTAADIKTSGYLDIAEVAPGRLLAVYDAHDTDMRGYWLWEPQEVANGVFGRFVDVNRVFGGSSR